MTLCHSHTPILCPAPSVQRRLNRSVRRHELSHRHTISSAICGTFAMSHPVLSEQECNIVQDDLTTSQIDMDEEIKTTCEIIISPPS
jgi:hypothetical protein